jgi:hypothetical protein
MLGQVRRYGSWDAWEHGGAVSGDDDGIGEPDEETGGDDGVGWAEQVISIYPYVPLKPFLSSILSVLNFYRKCFLPEAPWTPMK